MSAASKPPQTPTAEELEQVAVPAVVRRTPRIARLIVTGALVGIVVGVVIGLVLPHGAAGFRFNVVLLTSLSFATLGALVTGAVASRPTSQADPARIGLVIGFAIALFVLVMARPKQYNILWTLVSVAVLIGIPYFARMFGKSFAVNEPPSPADDPVAAMEAMRAQAAIGDAKAAGSATSVAAKKPTTRPTATRASAAKSSTKKPATKATQASPRARKDK